MKIDIDINENYKEITLTVKAPEMTPEVVDLIGKLKTTNKNVVGRIEQKMHVLNPQDILLFYSQEQKIFADTMKGTYEIKQKLYEIEEELKGEGFVRISKFAIANINKIRDMEMFFNGSLVANFINGKQEAISRRYVSKVKEYLGIGGK